MPSALVKCYGLEVTLSTRHRHFAAVLLFFFLFLTACNPRGPAGAGSKSASGASIRAVPVSDDGFAAAVHRLLRDGKGSPDRLGLLAGVMARQFGHASERFAAGQQEGGIASMTGAFLLARTGEYQVELVAGAEPALASAISVVAPRGDEGRAVAFMTMRNSLLPPNAPTRRDNEEHLAALRTWMRDTRKRGGLEALGSEQRVQTIRFIVEPTAETMTAARDATVRWIEQAIRSNEGRRTGAIRPRREELIEEFRAVRSGAESLVELYLRNGDAVGAFGEIERTAARKVTPPSLYDRLERAANGGDAAAWRDLLAWLWSPERKDSLGPPGSEGDTELSVDPNLLKAALFGTAVEAYRLDPTASDVSVALATLLLQYGLPEAAPLVLADGTVTRPTAAILSRALGIVLQSILREEAADDVKTARRVYAACDPLLSLAAKPEWRGKVEPGVARLRLAMGSIETRAGNLAAAKPLLESSIFFEPSVEALVTLAAIERQAGKPDAALVQLSRALATPEAKQNPLSAGEAQLNIYEVHKDMGAADKAKAALVSALTVTLEARKRANNAVTKGHAERLLARVLFRFSDAAGAARATERAFVAAGQDKRELSATVLEAAQRAFLRKDVAAARAAVNRGLAGELPDDDLVYAALWLLFTERDAKARSDGTATRALASIKDDGRWPSRLAAWGLGRTKEADLHAAARTMGQKTEAAFYTALSHKIAGDGAADKALAEVAKSPAIDLVEVQLARDLLLGPARFTNGPMPTGISIP